MSSEYWREKVALVTGGSSGLGRTIADALGRAGAKVVIAGLEPDGVRAAAEEMKSAGVDVLGVTVDITRQEDVDRLFQQTVEHYGRLDCLVNNAGRSMRGKVLDSCWN
jgi:NAD(P)-dependent dehydrogenase (short-subunit alcohol dehydrogenase family)